MNRFSRPDEHDNVVEPDVLAQRRALRDEALSDVELRLRDAEAELDAAGAERERLLAELRRRDVRLLAARQGEDSERRRRVEIEDELSAAARELELRVAALERRLASAQERIAELTAQLRRGEDLALRGREALAERDAATAEIAALHERLAAADERLAVERGRVAMAVAEERERAEAELDAERRRAEEARAAAGEAHAARRALEEELASRAGEVGNGEDHSDLIARLEGDLEVARDALAERLEFERELTARIARLAQVAGALRDHFLAPPAPESSVAEPVPAGGGVTDTAGELHEILDGLDEAELRLRSLHEPRAADPAPEPEPVLSLRAGPAGGGEPTEWDVALERLRAESFAAAAAPVAGFVPVAPEAPGALAAPEAPVEPVEIVESPAVASEPILTLRSDPVEPSDLIRSLREAREHEAPAEPATVAEIAPAAATARRRRLRLPSLRRRKAA